MTVWIMVFTSFPLELGGVWAPKVPPPPKRQDFQTLRFFPGKLVKKHNETVLFSTLKSKFLKNPVVFLGNFITLGSAVCSPCHHPAPPPETILPHYHPATFIIHPPHHTSLANTNTFEDHEPPFDSSETVPFLTPRGPKVVLYD